MTPKHTPGPWVIKDKPFCDAYLNVWKVAIYCDGLNFCQYIAGRTEEEALANAKLIAAAPEMLEVLLSFTKNIDSWLKTGIPADPKTSKQIYDAAKAAIKKAKL